MSAPASPSEDLESLFLEAMDLEPGQRVRFLESLRARRPELAERLAALLAADERNRDGTFESAIGHGFSEQRPLRIGSYTVLSAIGEGSIGAVFQARQAATGRVCAVKLLRPGLETPAWRRRFQREAEFLGRLNDAGIAQVYDAGLAPVHYNDGTVATRFYLAMEFVSGANAAQYVRREQPPQRRRVEVVERAARAVHHAHEASVIHRDLKPDNIMIADSGEVKVVDFGIGRLLATDSGNMTGLLIGTPGYVSPEQQAGMHDRVDTRTDVYALGATLYALLADRPPEPAGSASAPAAADRRLNAIVDKAMAWKPEDRYASAAHFADDLRHWANREPISARPAVLDGLRRWRRRHPAAAWAAALTLLAVTLLCVAVAIQPEWRYQLRARLLPARRITVDVLPFDTDPLPSDLAPLSQQAERLFAQEMKATALFEPRVHGSTPNGERIHPGAVNTLSDEQIGAFRAAGMSTVLTGSFDASGNQPWSTVTIRERLIAAADGRAVWTGTAQGSAAEIPALVAELCRGMQETLGGQEQVIRRRRAAPGEARQLAESGLRDWLRFDLIGARIALERAANLDVASASIRLALARALNSLGYRDLAREEAVAGTRLARSAEDRDDAEALAQELSANWPRAIELRHAGGASHPAQQLALAEDLIAARRLEEARSLIAREVAEGGANPGRNRWLLLRAQLLRELPGRPGTVEDATELVKTARESGPPLFLAEALDKCSESVVFASQGELSREMTEESRDVYAREGHREGMIREMGILGQRMQVRGSTAEAIRMLEQAMRALNGAGFDDTERYVARTLGSAYGRGYDLDLSRQMLTRALALSWKSRNAEQSLIDRSRLGIAYRDLGQLEESRRLLRESMPPGSGRPEQAARVLNALGETELLAGNTKAALNAGLQGRDLADRAQADDVRMDAITVIARAKALEGDTSKLDDDFGMAVETAKKHEMWGSLALAEMQWGDLLLTQGRAAPARRHLEESVRTFDRIDRPAFLAQARALLAIALARTRNLSDAAREAAIARTMAKGTGFAYTRVIADYAQAGLLDASGKKEEAGTISRAAIREADGFGFAPLAARIRAEFSGQGGKW